MVMMIIMMVMKVCTLRWVGLGQSFGGLSHRLEFWGDTWQAPKVGWCQVG